MWMIRRSGRGTLQTSFTPSAQICGFSPSSPNRAIAASVEEPLRALGEHRDSRNQIGARLEVRQLLALATLTSVARADADDAPLADEELRRRGFRQHRDTEGFRLLREEAPELGHGDDDVAVVAHRGWRRDTERRAPGQHVDGLTRNLAVRRDIRHREPPTEEIAECPRRDDRTREKVRAGLLSLLEHRHRHVAESLPNLGLLLEELAEPDCAREPAWAPSDDQHSDLDPLVRRIGGHTDRIDRAERRREVDRPCHVRRAYPRARTSSVSLGTIWWRSPTTPRSQKSKMGAFGSLLIATIVPELCIPTLCWIAPEIPHAM